MLTSAGNLVVPTNANADSNVEVPTERVKTRQGGVAFALVVFLVVVRLVADVKIMSNI